VGGWRKGEGGGGGRRGGEGGEVRNPASCRGYQTTQFYRRRGSREGRGQGWSHGVVERG
jgi:hypothetical protein